MALREKVVYSLKEFAERAQVDVKGSIDIPFENIAKLQTRIPGSLSFIASGKFAVELTKNPHVTAVLTSPSLEKVVKEKGIEHVAIVDNPMEAFLKIYREWVIREELFHESRISTEAWIHPSAQVADSDVIIEAGAILEENVVIKPGTYVGRNVVIRSNCVIGNVGFEVGKIAGKNWVVPHNGRVVLHDDVEIQAGCCIDRGVYGDATIVGENTKVDNLCYFAHNVHIGKECLIAGQSAILGGATLGNGVWIGPGSTISNQVTIGDHAKITLGSSVFHPVEEGDRVTGYFAREHQAFKTAHRKLFSS